MGASNSYFAVGLLCSSLIDPAPHPETSAITPKAQISLIMSAPRCFWNLGRDHRPAAVGYELPKAVASAYGRSLSPKKEAVWDILARGVRSGSLPIAGAR